MQPVSAFRPNGLGLFGLYGNAYEWCMDKFEPYSSADVFSDDTSQGGKVSNDVDSSRVLRGGSFSYVATLMRSASRSGGLPGKRYDGIGFRVSRTYSLLP